MSEVVAKRCVTTSYCDDPTGQVVCDFVVRVYVGDVELVVCGCCPFQGLLIECCLEDFEEEFWVVEESCGYGDAACAVFDVCSVLILVSLLFGLSYQAHSDLSLLDMHDVGLVGWKRDVEHVVGWFDWVFFCADYACASFSFNDVAYGFEGRAFVYVYHVLVWYHAEDEGG